MSEIEILKKRINQLEKENNQLKNDLAVYKLTQGTNISLEQYYFNQYLEQFNEIKNTRLAAIDQELNNFENELNILSEEIKDLDAYATLNETYQLEIAAIKNKKDENNERLSILEQECFAINNQLKHKQNVLKNATVGYYKTIIKILNDNQNNVLSNVEFVIEQLKVQLYDLVLECRNDNFTYMQMSKELEQLHQQLEYDNHLLEQQLNDLLAKIKTASLIEISTIKDGIVNAIDQRIRLKQEIIDTLEQCKERDLKLITDKINFYQISKKSRLELTNLLDTLITSLCNDLKKQDTFNNLKVMKEIKLSTLINKQHKLETAKLKFEELKQKEEKYYETYVTVSKYYDQLVDFLDHTLLTINENDYFKDIVNCYNNLNQEILETTTQYNIVLNNIAKLEQDYHEHSLHHFRHAEVKKINTSLSQLNGEKDRLSIVLATLNEELKNLEQNHKNIELLEVIKDKEFVESRINQLYQNLRKLKVQITKVKEELTALNPLMLEYESLSVAIKELENENNN